MKKTYILSCAAIIISIIEIVMEIIEIIIAAQHR